jgi:hypothetical protein
VYVRAFAEYLYVTAPILSLDELHKLHTTPSQTTVGENVAGSSAGSGIKASKTAAGSDRSLSDQGSDTFETSSKASAGALSARSINSSDNYEDTKDS